MPAALTTKPDASPLTEADLASHRIILEGLRALTPGLPIVSEEAGADLPLRDGMFWLVDPLDGTKEFIRRNGEFTAPKVLLTFTRAWRQRASGTLQRRRRWSKAPVARSSDSMGSRCATARRAC